MYTYISKCKNDKIKANKKKMTPACWSVSLILVF
jgi:hypothetical protein